MQGIPLAERSSRLVAVLIDAACAMVPMSLLLIGLAPVLTGGALMMQGLNKSRVNDVMGGAIGTVGMICVVAGLIIGLVLTLWQWWLLATGGVTIGKSFVGVRIVHAETGERATAMRALVLRVWLFGLFCAVPYIGLVLAVVDIFPIFTVERRCLHDYLAGTKVVRFKERQTWEMLLAMILGLGFVGALVFAGVNAAKLRSLVQEAAATSEPHTIIQVVDAGPVAPPVSTPPPPPPTVPEDDSKVIYVFTDDEGVPHIVQGMKNVPEKFRAVAERK